MRFSGRISETSDSSVRAQAGKVSGAAPGADSKRYRIEPSRLSWISRVRLEREALPQRYLPLHAVFNATRWELSLPPTQVRFETLRPCRVLSSRHTRPPDLCGPFASI